MRVHWNEQDTVVGHAEAFAAIREDERIARPRACQGRHGFLRRSG